MNDPHQWLEDVDGEKALAWVRQQNAQTALWARGPRFSQCVAAMRAVLDSKEKIPYVNVHAGQCYNLWRDAEHPRGLWRRTSLAAYVGRNPPWETVLDVDALGAAENTGWVFHHATFLKPDYHRCLLALSPGGSDATVVREFDLETKAFVQDGFALPQAKSSVSWIDPNTLFVCTEDGPDSLTTSGYPRTVKRWRRGTRWQEAPEVYSGAGKDVSVSAWHDATPGYARDFVTRSPSFFTQEMSWLDPSGTARKIDVPDSAEVLVHRAWLLVHLRNAWTEGNTTYPGDTVIAADFDRFMAGERAWTPLFTPSPTASLQGITCTRDHVILTVLDDVKTRLRVLTMDNAHWRERPLVGAPPMGTASVGAVDSETNDFFMTVEDFLTPTTLWYGTVDAQPRQINALPAFFDAANMCVEQHFAVSQDGTRVPYFQVSQKDLPLHGKHRTLLNGYGGFEVSLLPAYSGTLGTTWLKDGGVYVLANIRGGGEYGPAWHAAALKEHRHRAYEDFAAVAQDLIRRGVTRPESLGIQGGSNGGLLVGNMITRYPQLFGAVVCRVPLLDMQRYTHLLAGASWMGEYGDPDKPEEWDYIETFSPYHNLRDGTAYPPVLFSTSTRDDRVHPGHARKMMEKMRIGGHDVHYYENIEGGHGGAADNAQAAYMSALGIEFLYLKLRGA